MKLTEEIKNKITEILNDEWFKKKLYEGLTEEERDKLGMVYTPPEICIQMIEKFDYETLADRNILDPACGSGNLLIACLIAGADPNKLYGNDYNATAVRLCRERLHEVCRRLEISDISDWQIHQGNALIADCLTEFRSDYDSTILKDLLAEDSKMLNDPEAYRIYKLKAGDEFAIVDKAGNIQISLFGGLL